MQLMVRVGVLCVRLRMLRLRLVVVCLRCRRVASRQLSGLVGRRVLVVLRRVRILIFKKVWIPRRQWLPTLLVDWQEQEPQRHLPPLFRLPRP